VNDLALTGDSSPLIENPSLILFDAARMHALMQFAEMMSQSLVTVPKHLHGKPSDCMAITLQAMRWRMDPYVVAGKTHVVNGNLGYEAQLVVAVLKNSGAVEGRPHYDYKGDGAALECRAGFIPKGESAVVWTEWLAISAIQVKNSPLWKTNPKQQFGYLQARNWARLYAPDALLGVYTSDELEQMPPRDMGNADEVTPPPGPRRKSDAAAPPPPATTEGEGARTDGSVPPQWPAESFAAQLVRWTKAVTEGLKSIEDILATARSKGTLTAEQEAAIRNIPVPPPAGEKSSGAVTAPQIAYLRGKLKAANIPEASICDRFGVMGLELLSGDQFDQVKADLLAMG
jgi:hypothetical protein